MEEYVKDKLIEYYEDTIESSMNYDGDVEKPDYYSLFCKAISKKKDHMLMGSNVCMFNCKLNDKDSILMLFSIPINSEESGSKTVAERVMEIVEALETTFVTLDSIRSLEVKEDKVVYVKAIKTLNGG